MLTIQGLPLADISSRIAESIEAKLASPTVPGAWLQSRHAYEEFPRLDSAEIEHHGFAIGMPATSFGEDDRQLRGHGSQVATTVGVRWGHRLRAEAVAADRLAAYAAEEELVNAILDTNSDPRLLIIVQAISRGTARGGLAHVGSVDLLVGHRYRL